MKYFIYIAWFLTGIGASIVGHKTLESYILPNYSTSTVNKNEPSLSELLNRRSALEYKFPIIKQDRFSFCGIASVANVLNSFGISVPNQKGLLKSHSSPLDYWNVYFSGVTLEEMEKLINSHGSFETTIVRPNSIEDMTSTLKKLDDPSVRIIANFSRVPLFGEHIGHHSPIGAYEEATGNVLLLDVTEGYGNYLVEKETLFVAIQTSDSETKRNRGFLVVRKPKFVHE